MTWRDWRAASAWPPCCHGRPVVLVPPTHLPVALSGPIEAPRDGSGEAAREWKSLKSAGTLIGWFERALFFALLVAGSPEAAAVALTAKSVARFPLLSKHEEGFAEYSLIGTLSSLTIATATAIAVRGALGLSAL